MTPSPPCPPRTFLFLQGPHGPFFKLLAAQLKAAGASVWRVGFNAGDRAFWPDTASYIPFDGLCDDWPTFLQQVFESQNITDIVLYGDTRSIHAQAITAARARNMAVHVFEEGYLRPYWVTYERDGSNGHSHLMSLTIDEMHKLHGTQQFDRPVPPSHWGDLREHIFYGALYHWLVMARNGEYPNFKPHRSLKVTAEFQLYLKRLLLIPVHAIERFVATRRIQRGAFPYHLALLQLEHDASFQMHGPFATQSDFLDCVLDGFAKGAPSHHHLVFKAHPLEDGRTPIRTDIKRLARQHGIAKRVHFVRGGKLARLLDHARTATTVNSTAAQQALWRGIPLRAFGRAVYSKPELVSDQPLAAFYSNPTRPDQSAYRQFRDFLLATSQLPGSFYAQKGRRQVLRQVPDMMLAQHGPYAQTTPQSEALRQQLRVVD